MTKRLTLFSLLIAFTFACSKDNFAVLEAESEPAVQRTPMAKSQINEFVEQQLFRHDKFEWQMADDYMVYSAAVQTDSIVAVGYKPSDFVNLDEKIHTIDLSSPEWLSAKEKVMAYVVKRMNQLYPGNDFKQEDLLAFPEDEYLPALDLRIWSEELISELRSMPEVRYVEPMGYGSEQVLRSGSGCGASANSNIPSADFTYTSPNARVSWHLNDSRVPQAWSTSTGAGIGVALLDTGTSPNQSKLGSNFTEGLSGGRFIYRRGFHETGSWWWRSLDGPDDQCGHGTQMAGLIAAPRGNNGTPAGAAYQSNLIALRVTSDVIINSSNEKRGVADGLTYSANRSDVQIISMSIGDVFSNSRVADAIRYANGRGKLIFAAAGTSLTWTSWWGVIFPANMSETVAVPGVKDGLPLQKCNTCHDGSGVDFVATMQRRSDDNRTALTLAMSGNTPGTVGGSSAATATTAGVAALVWATNPSMSKGQVLQRLKEASQFYPGRDGNFGWGRINAEQAVLGGS
ncbi:MAG: S8/S53 family peptidase, partial [Saprospiraceae bacterium]|nr:S8/S53 family peptidase [Saprospiraceae bacterium]